MIGKCMGKLLKGSRMFTPEVVLEKYVEAVGYCPDKSGNDHIFEPHHKLVSSACKYVLQGLMEVNRVPNSSTQIAFQTTNIRTTARTSM